MGSSTERSSGLGRMRFSNPAHSFVTPYGAPKIPVAASTCVSPPITARPSRVWWPPEELHRK
eukprot:6289480-Pyramimonas_sp.AAC.1